MRVLLLLFLILSQVIIAQVVETPPSEVVERVDINEGADKQAQLKKKNEKIYPLNTSLATTIITGEDIRSSGARNLSDVLRAEFGVRAIESGTSSVASIRGTKSDQIMVMMNGMPLNNAQGFTVDLKSIPIYNVDRVEIIRGPASSRYGAKAVGGVINVVTIDNNIYNGIENYVGYGSYDVFSLATLMGRTSTNNKHNFFVSGLFSTSDGNFNYSIDSHDILGDSIKYEGGVRNNKTLKANIYASYRYNINQTDTIKLDISALADNKEIPDAYDEKFDGDFGNQYQEVQRYGFNFNYNNNSLSIFNLSLNAGVLHQARNYRNDSSDDVYNNLTTRIAFSIDRVDEFFGVFIFKNQVDVEYKNEYFHTYWSRDKWFTGKKPNDVTRHNVSLSYTPELSFPNFNDTDVPRFTLYPALRFDTSLVFDAKDALPYFTPSYSIGALYSFDKDRKYNIKVNFGTGYKLPGFDELYPIETDLVKAPPTLLREESLYGDVGFIVQPINMIKLEGFYHIQKVRDMIVWIEHPIDLYRMAVNVEGAFLHGGEISLLFSLPIKQALSRIELKASYLYQFGIAIGEYVEGKSIPNIPAHSANGKLSYIFEGTDKIGCRFDFFTHYIGQSYDDLINLYKLDDVVLFDLIGSVTIVKTLSIEGGVKNISDARYENTRGYLQPGREWYAAVRGKF